MQKPIDLIYILSLGHSGSTLLDYVLSHYQNSVGIGESYGVLTKKPLNVEDTKDQITSGNSAKESYLWKHRKEIEQISEQNGRKEAYKRILEIIKENGKELIIDSSKKPWLLEILNELHKDGEINLHTILLIRDMRGWANSMNRIEEKTGLWHRPAFYTMFKWYLFNRDLIKFLKDKNISHLRVGYEYFCQNPEKTISEVISKFNLDKEKFSLKNNPDSQIIYGNRFKKEVGKDFEIKCDLKWQKNGEVVISSRLLFPVLFWNNKMTYNLEEIKNEKSIPR